MTYQNMNRQLQAIKKNLQSEYLDVEPVLHIDKSGNRHGDEEQARLLADAMRQIDTANAAVRRLYVGRISK